MSKQTDIRMICTNYPLDALQTSTKCIASSLHRLPEINAPPPFRSPVGTITAGATTTAVSFGTPKGNFIKDRRAPFDGTAGLLRNGYHVVVRSWFQTELSATTASEIFPEAQHLLLLSQRPNRQQVAEGGERRCAIYEYIHEH